jgi:hypothetical protein
MKARSYSDYRGKGLGSSAPAGNFPKIFTCAGQGPGLKECSPSSIVHHGVTAGSWPLEVTQRGITASWE